MSDDESLIDRYRPPVEYSNLISPRSRKRDSLKRAAGQTMNFTLLTTFSVGARGLYENCSFVAGWFFVASFVGYLSVFSPPPLLLLLLFFLSPRVPEVREVQPMFNKFNTCSRGKLQLAVRRVSFARLHVLSIVLNLKIYRNYVYAEYSIE